MKNFKLKKIFLVIFLILSIFGLIGMNNISYAKELTAKVTEPIPGANCILSDSGGVYTCTYTVDGFFSELLKYFTFLAGLFSVLALVVGGIMYSMGGANEGMKNSAKEYITKSLIGLVVLLLSGVILYMIAPWVYK